MSTDEEEEWDELSSGDERKKRPFVRRKIRKKSRSLDLTDEDEFLLHRPPDQSEQQHTGLSPRINRMDIVSKTPPESPVFFLEDGVETFSVDGDPRVRAVQEIYSALDQRLQRAAVEAGLGTNDPALSNLKQKIALRAAQLEANCLQRFGGSTPIYQNAIYQAVSWIFTASDTELKALLDGTLNHNKLEDAQQQPQPPPQFSIC